MRTTKIIIGFLILMSIGSEYANASRQLFTFFSPGILLGSLTLLVLSTWLIGSGISKDKLRIKSIEFLKYYFGAFIIFGLIAFIKIISYRPQDISVEFNNINIPIGRFVDGTRRIIPDLDQRKAYCTCIVEKLTKSDFIIRNYKGALVTGEIDKIFQAIIPDGTYAKLGLDSCYSKIDLKWNDAFEKSIRENIKNSPNVKEFEKTNKINTYCDCMIKEYKNCPLNEILTVYFQSSKLKMSIDSYCIQISKK